jgi:hypothetical protein
MDAPDAGGPPASAEEFLAMLQAFEASGGSSDDLPADIRVSCPCHRSCNRSCHRSPPETRCTPARLQDLLAKVNEQKGGASSEAQTEELVPEPG